MLNIKRIVKQLASAEAAEIAEAALVFPLVFMLLLGIIWFGRAFNIYSTIQQAAQQGAIIAARSSCVTCGDASPSTDTVDDAVLAVLSSSHLDPVQIKSGPSPIIPGQPPCPAPPVCVKSPSKFWVCHNMQLNQLAGSNQAMQCGTVVSFQYQFEDYYLPFTSLNLLQIPLRAQAQSRMEN